MKHFLLIVLFMIVNVAETAAIPAFARKYNMTCKTCHAPFPKLKAYGEEFAANGFALRDKDAPRYFMDTGDDKLSLIRDFPLAARIEGYLTYKNKKYDQTGPSALKLLSGGLISDNVSYYVYYILEQGEPGKIEDAYIMFNNIFKQELDLYVGQFQVSDPLFKRELRLTSEDYLIYKYAPGYSKASLTYDRGIMLNYSLPTKTDLFFEVLNGAGIGTTFSGNGYDNDNNKNFLARVNQDVAEFLSIGAFGYAGRENLDPDSSALNKTSMFGIDAVVSAGPIELNLQYISRNDDNPTFLNIGATEIKANGGFAELIYLPDGDDSKWYGVMLYNIIESDDNTLDKKSVALHLGHIIRRNLRFVVEYGYDLKNKAGRFGAGFVAAF